MWWRSKGGRQEGGRCERRWKEGGREKGEVGEVKEGL